MFYVYVLYSTFDRKFYIGYSSNLKRRISEHKNRKVHSTARRKNLSLIFYEAYISKRDAQRREKYFKTNRGKKALKLMLQNTLKEIEN